MFKEISAMFTTRIIDIVNYLFCFMQFRIFIQVFKTFQIETTMN